jgi:hypothetical protein
LGTLTAQVDPSISVTRVTAIRHVDPAGQTPANLTAATENVPAANALQLQEGDGAFVPANVAGELRSERQQPAVRLVSSLRWGSPGRQTEEWSGDGSAEAFQEDFTEDYRAATGNHIFA